MLLSILALALAQLTLAAPQSSNTTLEARTSNWESARCCKVSGNYRNNRFDFGCLCDDDLDDFARNNGLSSSFKGQIANYINYYGKSNWYPPNSQPTCDGNGGYNCGSLSRKSDGTCPTPPSNCPSSQAYNGGCCPRGQYYSNGKCCGNTGCNRSGSNCTPVLSCATYKSNGVCCPSGTSGWIGQDTVCCPPSQDEVNGVCVCPSGQVKDKNDQNSCVPSCPDGTQLSSDKKSCVCKNYGWSFCENKYCCPPGQTGANGKCNCPAGQTQSPTDTTKCVPTCPDGTQLSSDQKSCVCKNYGWSFCENKYCCPPGQTGANGKCNCPAGQTQSPTDTTKCVPVCPDGTQLSSDQKSCVCKNYGWSLCENRYCCPPGQTGANGKCNCPSGQTQSPTDNTKCVPICPSGSKLSSDQKSCVCNNAGWTLYDNKVCCPSGQTGSNGQCICPAGQTQSSTDSTKCVPVCPSGTKLSGDQKTCVCNNAGWTLYNNKVCCPSGQTGSNGQCICPAGQTQSSTDSTKCVPVCPSGTKLSGDQKTCVCNNAGWTLYDNKICCPSGQTGSNGQCVCPPGQTQSPSDCNKCVPACPAGTKLSSDQKSCVCNNAGWTLYDKTCCPSGQTGVNNQCKCPAGQVVSSTDSTKCVPACPNGTKLSSDQKSCVCNTAGYTFYTTVCCPSGQTEVNGQCACPNGKIVNPNDKTKCIDNCQPGHHYCNSRCCPTGSSEVNGKCVCDDPSKELNSDGTACQPKCGSGEKFNTNICCKTYLVESNMKCVCPNAGDVDTGSSCSKCPAGYNWNPYMKKCDPPCPAGTYYKIGWKGQGFCCDSGKSACNTVCCPVGTEEVGNTGKCCKPGSTVVNGKCVEPSGHRRRAPKVVDEQIQFGVNATIPYFGLEANKGYKLCPKGFAACPIPGLSSDEYECLDTETDIQSCGGCVGLNTGEDCTAIPGARWMGCEMGKCSVYSCRSGWTKVNGTSCVKTKPRGY